MLPQETVNNNNHPTSSFYTINPYTSLNHLSFDNVTIAGEDFANLIQQDMAVVIKGCVRARGVGMV